MRISLYKVQGPVQSHTYECGAVRAFTRAEIALKSDQSNPGIFSKVGAT